MTLNHEKLLEARAAKKVLLAAHRGTWGGNIIQNTIAAYENSLLNGADIIEVDVVQSTDGDFFVFHTGQEPGVLGTNKNMSTMSTQEILSYRFINSSQDVTNQQVNRLEDVLEHFKGRCLINIDRSWWFWSDIIKLLDRHNMSDQILLKSSPEPELLKILACSGSDLMYLPIVRREEQLKLALQCDVNTVAVELVFAESDSPLIANKQIAALHEQGLLVWANALTLDDSKKLSGGHDDNTAILHDMDIGWGWLVDKQFDIIQTDWPWLFKRYIDKRY